MFRIIKKQVDGVWYWTVERHDEKAFDGAICGYNFSLENWQLAIDCKTKLEAQFNP